MEPRSRLAMVHHCRPMCWLYTRKVPECRPKVLVIISNTMPTLNCTNGSRGICPRVSRPYYPISNDAQLIDRSQISTTTQNGCLRPGNRRQQTLWFRPQLHARLRYQRPPLCKLVPHTDKTRPNLRCSDTTRILGTR
jgi:hypothetical protein